MAMRNDVPSLADMKAAWLEALALKNEGRISPRILLDAVREDPACPFRDEFEWDAATAHEKYLLAQAAGIIRRWKGTIIRVEQESKRLSVSVTRRVQSPSGQRGKGKDSYELVENIMADPEKRADLLRTVSRELMAYRKRYAKLTELAEIWYAIDIAFDKHATTERGEDPDRPTASA